jgi:hypothetical protein
MRSGKTPSGTSTRANARVPKPLLANGGERDEPFLVGELLEAIEVRVK